MKRLLPILLLAAWPALADTTIKGPITFSTGLTVVGSKVSAPSGSSGINQLTGDVTAGPGIGSQGATLPNIVSPSTNLKITYNAKGQVTAGASAASTDLSDSAGLARLGTAGQALTGGFHITAASLGTVSSGTLTIDCGTSPLQFYTNGGAHTLAAPAADSNCLVDTINNGSAGAITFSGFTVGTSTGDALTTTNTNGFTLSIWRINGVAGYRVAAHQ